MSTQHSTEGESLVGHDEESTPIEPPPAAAEEDKRPLEAWGEAAGLLPQFSRGTPPKPNPEYWKYAAARAFKGWSDGDLVTEDEFKKAVDEALTLTQR